MKLEGSFSNVKNSSDEQGFFLSQYLF
jgi:hypothetical protein